jgi:hypothetical protein
LKEYRKQARASEEALSEGEDAAQIVIKAAQEASVKLQDTVKASVAQINRLTNEACAAIHEAALAAERKILDSRERALTRLKETLQAYR